MGKGGQQAARAANFSPAGHWTSPYNPLDPKAPKLPTKGEIKAVIPKDCFKRSYIKGLSWVLFDLTLAALLVFAARTFLAVTPPQPILSSDGCFWLAGWSLYVFCMGSTMAGCWVLAHECGHGALFPSRRWNNAFGFVIHQVLLCPYYSCRCTHAKHHQFTNHLHKDTTYVPETLSELGLLSLLPAHASADSKGGATCRASSPVLSAALKTLGNDPVAAFNLVFYHLVGWPLYLAGVSIVVTRANHDGSPNKGEHLDHFNPNSKLLPSKQKGKTLLSTTTLLATIGVLAKLSLDHGILAVALWYGFPVMILYFFFVTYTYLHHTDPTVPLYGEDEWTWMKGALTTVDRDYGIFNFLHHNIGSTHVVHHLFHEIPFYNVVRATRAVRDHLEPKGLYNFDPTPWWKALWRVFRKCQYVDDTCGIQYKKSFDDIVPLLRAKQE